MKLIRLLVSSKFLAMYEKIFWLTLCSKVARLIWKSLRINQENSSPVTILIDAHFLGLLKKVATPSSSYIVQKTKKNGFDFEVNISGKTFCYRHLINRPISQTKCSQIIPTIIQKVFLVTCIKSSLFSNCTRKVKRTKKYLVSLKKENTSCFRSLFTFKWKRGWNRGHTCS